MMVLDSAKAIHGKMGRSDLQPYIINRICRFLCTSSVSNVLYNTLAQYIKQGYFDVNDKNLRFFNKLHPLGKARKGRYYSASREFNNYAADMFTYADSFLNVIRWHATEDGRLSEQFNKYSGFQKGAHDLTWSYGSFVSAVDDRALAKETLWKSLKAAAVV